MKNSIFCLLFLIVVIPASAQLKATVVVPNMVVNLLSGNVNGVEPDFSSASVKKVLPGNSSEVPESDTAGCGGLVSYKAQDIYFYTSRHYIEIGEKFTGKLSLPIMGAPRSSLFKYLGLPRIKDVTWDAYNTAYGILILYSNKAGNINKIQFSKLTAETIKLCEQ